MLPPVTGNAGLPKLYAASYAQLRCSCNLCQPPGTASYANVVAAAHQAAAAPCTSYAGAAELFLRQKARTAMLLAVVAVNIRAAGSRYMAMLLQGATLEELQMQKQHVQDLLNQNIRQVV